MPTAYCLPPLRVKRSIAYLPVNFLPFLALPVIATVFVSGVPLVCAAAGPAPPMSTTASAATAATSMAFGTWTCHYLRWFD